MGGIGASDGHPRQCFACPQWFCVRWRRARCGDRFASRRKKNMHRGLEDRGAQSRPRREVREPACGEIGERGNWPQPGPCHSGRHKPPGGAAHNSAGRATIAWRYLHTFVKPQPVRTTRLPRPLIGRGPPGVPFGAPPREGDGVPGSSHIPRTREIRRFVVQAGTAASFLQR